MKNIASIVIGLSLFAAPLAASADTFTRPLAVGSRGDDVAVLQKVLIDAEFLKVAATGYFGVLTKAAVIAYQKANGLEPVGSVGPKTRALLNVRAAAEVNTQVQTPIATPPVSSGNTTPTPQTSPSQSTTSPQTSTSTSAAAPAPTPSPNDPPKITLVSPTSAVSRTAYETNFSVSTDKPALCRYGTQQGMNLSSMIQFVDSNNGQLHTRMLTGLLPDGYYIYYVRCEDYSAHLSQDFEVKIWTNAQ